jgi:hypothetical protein
MIYTVNFVTNQKLEFSSSLSSFDLMDYALCVALIKN